MSSFWGTHQTMKINLHFLFRLITRMQTNRIFKMRSLVDALENGQIFKQENFHGFIIKGSNGLIIILKKLGHKKASLDSIYTVEKKFPNWKEFATYAKTAKNDFVE